MKKIKNILILLPLSLLLHRAWAGGIPTLSEVEVRAGSNTLLGVASSANEGTVTARQLENRPLLRPAETLEVVPGLIVSQHSGDGKANQYYLRGFNLDHGTDFATWVMGMPVNLPSHAHGQGYTDLNFLIPELVERMTYRKGPYYASEGDFSSAGSVRIDYRRRFDAPFVDLTAGAFGYQRLLAGASPAIAGGHLLLAAETSHYDGPWQVPERFRKDNFVARYGRGSRDNGWSVALMGYEADWTATDQVAVRAVDQGMIGPYGSLDPSTGGHTRRYSLSADWAARQGNARQRVSLYAIDYQLDLWSNFTYALDNPVRGDQFLQADRRQTYGGHAAQTWFGELAGKPVEASIGLDLRQDRIGRVGLYKTERRQVYDTVREDKVRQTSLSLWTEAQVQWLEKCRATFGLRGDAYDFQVSSNLAENSGSRRVGLLSPKLGLVFGPWAETELYLNFGTGFHSNDGRGAMTRIDPASGAAVSPVKPLARTRGHEAGVRTAWLPGLHSTLSLWQLDIESELLFIGDAGTTEASRASRRTGIEWANYWQPADWLTLDADYSFSRARYVQHDPAGNFIPGAVERVASLGLNLTPAGPWSAGLRGRYFGPRPLTEDNSVRSPDSLLFNLHLAYRPHARLRVTLDVLNLFDRRVSDIDYFYPSRLRHETVAIADRHTHPAERRMVRAGVRISF